MLQSGSNLFAGFIITDNSVTVQGCPFCFRNKVFAAALANGNIRLIFNKPHHQKNIVIYQRAKTVLHSNFFAECLYLRKLRTSKNAVLVFHIKQCSASQIIQYVVDKKLKSHYR